MIDTTLLQSREALTSLLSQAGVEMLRGDQCRCPFHGEDNNPSAGIYYKDDKWRFKCFTCGETGDYYDMQEKINGKGIKDVASEDMATLPPPKPPEPKKLKIKREDIRAANQEEVAQLAEAKQIKPEALKQFEPLAIKDLGTAEKLFGDRAAENHPVILLPALSPRSTAKACGFLRVRADGKPVVLANGNTAKYPIVSGSTHGLLGLRAAAKRDGEIWFCEAWRDALAMIGLGYNAIASTGGASTWRDEWLPVFKDRSVVVCFDADKAGQTAAIRAIKAIGEVAADVTLGQLPYEVKNKHGADLFDLVNE